MPELPPETRSRLLAQGLSERDADVLMAIDMGREVGHDGVLGHGAVAYFDTVARGRDPKIVVNWWEHFSAILDASRLNVLISRMTHELLGQLTLRKETFKENKLSTEQLGEIIDLVQSKKITGMLHKEFNPRFAYSFPSDRA